MKKVKENVMMQEMDLQEMKKVNGGLLAFLIGAIVGGFIYDCISEPGDCINGFRDGANSNFK